MTHSPKNSRLSASETSSLGHEYVLSQPLELEFGAFSDSAAIPLEQLDARDAKALAQWQHALLAVRQAFSGRRS